LPSEELAASLVVTMKEVGAPLSGLIRSEGNRTYTRAAGSVVVFALMIAHFSA
jgi:hypothetical protein